jgi:Fe-S-cluster-containing hydrogenase component 2
MPITAENWTNSTNFVTREKKINDLLTEILNDIEDKGLSDGIYLSVANNLMKIKKLTEEKKTCPINNQHRQRASRPNPELTNPISQPDDNIYVNCYGCSRPIICPYPLGSITRDMSNMVRHKKTAVHINICNDKSIVKLTGKLNTIAYRQRLNIIIKLLDDPVKQYGKQIINMFREIKARKEECLDCN